MGYEVGRFVEGDKIDECFKCGVCLEIFREPVMIAKCEHIYCRVCLVDWLKAKRKCPEDRSEVDEADIVETSRFFRNLYDKLRIKCEFVKVSELQVY